jgi:hypothetical protein
MNGSSRKMIHAIEMHVFVYIVSSVMGRPLPTTSLGAADCGRKTASRTFVPYRRLALAPNDGPDAVSMPVPGESKFSFRSVGADMPFHFDGNLATQKPSLRWYAYKVGH